MRDLDISPERPLLVYVHVPFCSSKCHFCDWVQEIPVSELRLAAGNTMRADYIAALCRQIRAVGPRLMDQGYRPRILYWGGGTASILTENEAGAVMAALRDVFPFDDLDEATIESSPETLSPERLAMFRALGFRRISIGLQSLDDRRLRTIGRSHSAEIGAQSVWDAHAAGFEAINIDLITGLPDETLAEVDASVRAALELPASHVSLYPFRPAHGTVARRQLGKGLGGRLDMDEQIAAYHLARDLLNEAGLAEYALSHFGAPRCHSDMAYFQLTMDWAGFGSGATSLLGGRFQSTQRGALHGYVADPQRIDEDRPATAGDIASRLMYQALTTWEGVAADDWAARTGQSLAAAAAIPEVASLLTFLGGAGRLTRDAAGIRLDRDAIARAFITLQFLNSPAAARTRRGADALFAGY
ncbi:coproporphyrinogen-III oxidase family protein [Psychromarinibacter sp. C21-152]|uniref:Coproporphyrinogen-III oxidase family protein n=1 Tax=Psychromarinibacter sediminicola TaxID=3033385 RepID=A0AAE3TB15_9RHOB|nr:coproporphyrinogen-III oxidase family protein [Psychromarinibacter sediminicola]MDF0602559.1 coproporphyrinogen-III oxidase family protein [Psychromarinibacter sediminicola]